MNHTDPTAAAIRAAAFRDAEEICDEAGAVYTSKALSGEADSAYALMQRFRRKAEEAEEVAAVVSLPTDRAALAAVRALHQPMERGPFTICAHCSGWDGKWRCLGVVTDYPCPTVRALDGEQAAEAHPPQHAWRVETRDGEWVRGSHFLHRQAAVERYETANSTAPLWQDGTPIERRIVRETTTYTVEEPAPVAQQPAAADDA